MRVSKKNFSDLNDKNVAFCKLVDASRPQLLTVYSKAEVELMLGQMKKLPS
jgi:hypothetical protein